MDDFDLDIQLTIDDAIDESELLPYRFDTP
jgi:hypothetical protein